MTDVFSSSFVANSAGNAGLSYRQTIPVISDGGSTVSVSFNSTPAGAFSASHVSICVQSSGYNCASTPVELTFGGASGFSIPAGGGTIDSDFVNLPTVAGQTLLVIIDVTSPNMPRNSAGAAGWDSYPTLATTWNMAAPSGSYVSFSSTYGFNRVRVGGTAPPPPPPPPPPPGITLYVAPTGSDSNTGTLAAPFLTTNAAWQYAQANLNLAGQSLRLQHAGGIYPKPILFSGLMTGQAGPVFIQGNLSFPENVVLTNSAGPPGQTAFQAQDFAWIAIQGVQLQSVGAQVLRVFNNALVSYQNIDFGPSGGTHVAAVSGGRVTITGNYSISANANLHFNANLGGSITVEAPSTITLKNSPHFSQAFAWCQQGTYFEDFPLSFSGAGSAASNFAVILNGVMNTGTGNTNHFPFGAPYSITSGGQYN